MSGLRVAVRAIEQLFRRPPARDPGTGETLSLLNGVRGLAALGILFWHYEHFYFPIGASEAAAGIRDRLPLYHLFWPFYEHGHYAVQIFWILSGVVFSHIYFSSAATTGDFVVSRFARLYPLHLLTLLVIALLQIWANTRYGSGIIYQTNGAWQFVQHLLLVSGWGFPDGRFSFNGPVWSVSAEIAVYVVFWLSRGWLVRRGLLWPLLIMAAGILARAAGVENEIVRCLYHFMAGVVVFVVGVSMQRRSLLLGLAATALAAVLFAMRILPATTVIPLSVIAVTGGLMLVCIVINKSVPRPLASACNWIGDSTYGIYLWHVPVQAALFLVVGGSSEMAAYADSPAFLGAFILGMIALARLSYNLVEVPARVHIKSLAAVRRVDAPIAAP